MQTLPTPARLLGAAGLIPFAGLALASLFGWPGAVPALIAYGATILAFLGAVHWGLALRAPAAERGADLARFGLGVIPALLGWVALLLPPSLALGLLALAILATATVESLGARLGLVPGIYLRLRWMLSFVAATCLIVGLSSL